MSTVGERATEALERGIELYGQGDLDAALGEWERALALDPGLAQAEEYATYVRENYDALRAQLDGAALADGSIVEPSEPMPDRGGESEFVKVDSGELPRVDVDARAGGLAAGGSTANDFDLELGGSVPSLAAPGYVLPPPAPQLEDDDWSDLMAAARPPAVSAPSRETPAARAETVPAKPSSRATIAFGGAGAPILPSETHALVAKGRMPTSPAVRAALEAVEPSSPAIAIELDDSAPALSLDDGPSIELDEGPFELDDEPPPPARAPGLSTPQRTGASRPSALDEGLLAAYDDAFDDEAAGLGLDEPEPSLRRQTAPPPAVRGTSATQVASLIDLASSAAARGDRADAFQAATTALEAGRALPAGLDDRSAERLTAAFIAILGNMDRTPLVAVPMHEITRGSLDHRTGFLLSRIDGMLTFEDILDVSGMPRLDAAHLLCALVQRGYVEVR